MSRTYATESEFAAWLDPDTLPDGAARLLRDASLEVDEMLVTAIYHVDHDGAPTEIRVIEALRDATCAQAEYRAEHGDEATIAIGDVPVSLGPLSIGGRSNSKSDGTALPQHCPKAMRVLRLAGLMPGTVQDG